MGNIALLLTSSACALAAVELIAKLILNPVDYLSPVLVRDEILGIRPTGKSGGHVNWAATAFGLKLAMICGLYMAGASIMPIASPTA